jgi:hypothetical protein
MNRQLKIALKNEVRDALLVVTLGVGVPLLLLKVVCCLRNLLDL